LLLALQISFWRANLFFTTENSQYEVDVENKRIRRLTGDYDPTTRQGADGVWKMFSVISEIQVGQPVLVGWEHDSLNEILRSTLTSTVTTVEP
jgi:hypothetical protein